MLKKAREEKGLTVDEVSSALFIKKRIVEAIESGDWESLPYPVYVKGYLNQYAALLRIADLFQAETISSKNQPSPETIPPENQPSPETIPPENQPSPKVQEVAAAKNEGAPKGWRPKTKQVIAASAVGVLVVGFLFFQHLTRKGYVEPPAQSVASTSQRVQTSPKSQSAEAGTNSQPVEASPVAAEQSEKLVLKSKKLTIVCQERTWVRIVIDGAEQKEFMLNPEEVVMLNAEKNFDLLIGNAGGVKLFYNGKDTGFTGENGEVKHITLS